MCKSQEKFSLDSLYGFNANTEKLPSESPLLSILIVAPVTPENSILNVKEVIIVIHSNKSDDFFLLYFCMCGF